MWIVLALAVNDCMLLFLHVTVIFECLGKKDLVMYGFEPVVHICAAAMVQLYRQSR